MNGVVVSETGDVFEGVVWDDEDLDLGADGQWTIADADGRTGAVTVVATVTTIMWSDGSTSVRRVDGESVTEVLSR